MPYSLITESFILNCNDIQLLRKRLNSSAVCIEHTQITTHIISNLHLSDDKLKSLINNCKKALN